MLLFPSFFFSFPSTMKQYMILLHGSLLFTSFHFIFVPIRVIHSSHFSFIFHSFSTSFLNHFVKMKLKMDRKMIIFEKSNHALACTKIVIFTFIFTLHFSISNSFKLCSDMSSFAVTTTITHHCQPQSPPQCPTTTSDVVWAPGKCFSSLILPH